MLTTLSPIQFLIEYFLAFAFIGFAGLFYKTIQTHFHSGEKKKALLWVVIATLVGSVARYFWHFVAGVVFWGEYAPEGMSPVIYSLIVNGVTMIGAFVLCSIVLVLLLTKAPGSFAEKKLNLQINNTFRKGSFLKLNTNSQNSYYYVKIGFWILTTNFTKQPS